MALPKTTQDQLRESINKINDNFDIIFKDGELTLITKQDVRITAQDIHRVLIFLYNKPYWKLYFKEHKTKEDKKEIDRLTKYRYDLFVKVSAIHSFINRIDKGLLNWFEKYTLKDFQSLILLTSREVKIKNKQDYYNELVKRKLIISNRQKAWKEINKYIKNDLIKETKLKEKGAPSKLSLNETKIEGVIGDKLDLFIDYFNNLEKKRKLDNKEFIKEKIDTRNTSLTFKAGKEIQPRIFTQELWFRYKSDEQF